MLQVLGINVKIEYKEMYCERWTSSRKIRTVGICRLMNHRRFDKIREFLEDQNITLSRKARYSAVRHA